MSITDLKIHLKSNPTSKSKLHNNVLKYIIPYSPLLQKKERGREREEKKEIIINSITKQNLKIHNIKTTTQEKEKQK